jgi:hypothetical protein
MKKQDPCYFCVAMSATLSVGMIIATYRVGRHMLGLGRK